jgi:N-acetylmuramoyl-L-alanine amidase
MQVLFIVAGHGATKNTADGRRATDSGAMSEDRQTSERAVNVAVARLLIERLRTQNFTVVPIGVDQDLTLAEKTQQINGYCDQYFQTTGKALSYKNALNISLHCDWYGAASGAAGYYYGGSELSEELAHMIVDSVSIAAGLRYRWLKPDTSSRFGRLGIIRDTKPLSMLLEMGSLGPDLGLLKSRTGQERIANGIVSGIQRYIQAANGTTVQPADPAAANQFVDVSTDAWYGPSVYRMLEKGLFAMTADRRFYPHRNISRAELAVVMDRMVTWIEKQQSI